MDKEVGQRRNECSDGVSDGLLRSCKEGVTWLSGWMEAATMQCKGYGYG